MYINPSIGPLLVQSAVAVAFGLVFQFRHLLANLARIKRGKSKSTDEKPKPKTDL